MSFRKWAVLWCALLLVSPCFALGAQQVALGLVNTSTGIKPTSAKNKFKLTTDPKSDIIDASDYIPTSGRLNTYFDPTQFQLDTNGANNGVGTYALGASVQGDDPYHVSSFDVQLTGGGLLQVSDNNEGGDNYSTIVTGPHVFGDDPTATGTPTGYIYDIDFYVPTDSVTDSSPVTSNIDQDFYHLFLTYIGTEPIGTPGTGMTFETDDSFIKFAESPTAVEDGIVLPPGNDPGDQNPVITGSNIIDSAVPEISSAGFLGFVGVTLFLRRRKEKMASHALKALESAPQSVPQSAPQSAPPSDAV